MSFKLDFQNRTDKSIVLMFIAVFIAIIICSISNPNLIPNIIGIGLPLVTLAIAYDTYKLNRTNYKLALFNKRYEIYAALLTILNTTTTEGFLSDREHSKFFEKCKEAKFFFEDDVLIYLDDINKKIIEFIKYQNINAEKNKANLLTAFSGELLHCDEKFARYLYFREP